MSAPFSRTTISRLGSMRRARAAALRPAATPPITSRSMRPLSLFLHLLDEAQDIERLHGAVREEAVHGVLLHGGHKRVSACDGYPSFFICSTKLRISNALMARYGKKLFTASCSSVNKSNAVARPGAAP